MQCGTTQSFKKSSPMGLVAFKGSRFSPRAEDADASKGRFSAAGQGRGPA